MFREERNLKLALSKYKDKLARYWKVPLEFEAIDITQENFRAGRFPIIKKPYFTDAIGMYNRYGDHKVLKVNSRHSGFNAKLVDYSIEPYQGASRWGGYTDRAWDTVWLHFETMTGQGLPFHMPLRLAVQNGKHASVWQDSLLEYGLIEGVDFKFNHLRDMLILSPEGKDAIELVEPPEPMVIQFSAQCPVNELVGRIEGYWDKRYSFSKDKEMWIFPRFRIEACQIGIELL